MDNTASAEWTSGYNTGWKDGNDAGRAATRNINNPHPSVVSTIMLLIFLGYPKVREDLTQFFLENKKIMAIKYMREFAINSNGIAFGTTLIEAKAEVEWFFEQLTAAQNNPRYNLTAKQRLLEYVLTDGKFSDDPSYYDDPWANQNDEPPF